MKKTVLFITAFLCFSAINWAQISEGGTPFSFKQKIADYLDAEISEEVLPFVDVASLLAEDAIEEQYKNIPYRFAYPHQVNFTTSNSGKWNILYNGARIWRLKITSPGAFSLNLTFDEYNLPEGSKLFIYNKEKTQVIGAFTNKNNEPFYQMGTAPVKGESIVVEYYEPAGVSRSAAFRIGTVAHDYKDIFKQSANFNNSGSCNNNVVCPLSAGWEDQIRSVALITTSGGSRICTGSLVNNTCNDGTPYFLTANHCLGSGVNTWVFIFNYDSPQCTPSIDGPLSNSISGCTQRASNAGSDFALLELSSVPPSSYNVFYAGWDRSGIASTSQVAIHHPSGDVKKISFDNNPTVSVNWNGAACWEIGNWESGTTEPGSSGSPLFDNNNRVIGQLYGGTASCSSITDDNYGRFDVSWNGSSSSTRLSDWLDPCNTGATTNNGYPIQPAVALDAGIPSITSPANGASYCDPSVNPVVVLRNYGLDTLTQVAINYYVGASPVNTYNWTGSLATNQTEAVNLPALTLSTGSFTFEVYTSNPNGGTDANTVNDTKSSSFDIMTVTPVPLNFAEGFENTLFPPSGWVIENPDNQQTWERTTSANGFGSSTASVMFNNFDDDFTGQKDYLITPFLDFSQVVAPIQLDFNVAYARYNSSYHDSLVILASIDCGLSWQRVYVKGNNILSTTGTDVSSFFTPTNTQWRAESVNLDVYEGEPQVQIAFVNISGYGNNLYLDDINIYGTSTVLSAGFSASDTIVCTGNCVDFTDMSTGSPTGWEWSFPGALTVSSLDQNPSGICYANAGYYDVTLIVTDASDADTLVKSFYIKVVDNITAVISSTDVSCNGGNDGLATVNVSGGTSPYYYQWSNGNSSSTIAGLSSATYTVAVADSNGCSSIETVVISEPALLVLNIATVDATCGVADGEATVTPTGGTQPYTYSWVTPLGVQSTSTITGLDVGIYYITVEDANGCYDIDTVTIYNIGAPTLDVTVMNVSCYNGNDGSINLTVNGGNSPYTYSWSNNAITEDITGLTVGNYNVTVTDINNCVSNTSAQLTEPSLLTVSGVATNESCCPGSSNGEITTSVSGGTPGYTYLWSNSATTSDISGLAAGNYQLTVTDFNGCTISDSYTVGHDSITGISEPAYNQFEVRLYPNPTNGQIFISYNLPNEESLQFKVWNLLGAVIMESGGTSSTQGSLLIDLSGRAEGMYFVEINTGEYRKVEKVVLR